MSTPTSEPNRRDFLATSATTLLATSAGVGTFNPAQRAAAGEGAAIRSFSFAVPDEELADLRRRILTTRWPERETVTDETQGGRLVSPPRPQRVACVLTNGVHRCFVEN